MVNKMISIFKPKKIKDFNPSSLNIFTFNAGFKKRDTDVLLIVFDKIINVCCVYSKTSTHMLTVFPGNLNFLSNIVYCV